MAALVVQSRFAGLKIDDDYPSSETQKVKKTKPSTVKKPEPPKKTKNNNTKSQVLKYTEDYRYLCVLRFCEFSPICFCIKW